MIGQTVTNLSDVSFLSIVYTVNGIYKAEEIAAGKSLMIPLEAVIKSARYPTGVPASISVAQPFKEEVQSWADILLEHIAVYEARVGTQMSVLNRSKQIEKDTGICEGQLRAIDFFRKTIRETFNVGEIDSGQFAEHASSPSGSREDDTGSLPGV